MGTCADVWHVQKDLLHPLRLLFRHALATKYVRQSAQDATARTVLLQRLHIATTARSRAENIKWATLQPFASVIARD